MKSLTECWARATAIPYPGTMMTSFAARASAATSSTLSSVIVPSVGAPATGAAPLSLPNPPNTTFQIERFIARHMIVDRMAPLDPTSAPVTMSRSLPSMKPAAAAAHPE